MTDDKEKDFEPIESKDKFKLELKHLINSYSLENEANIPDYVLAEYLVDCLDSINTAVKSRDAFFGYMKEKPKVDAQ